MSGIACLAPAIRALRVNPITARVRRDPLGGLNLTEQDFGWGTRVLMDLADRHCGGRVVSVLEGGYDLDGLARSASAHVDALMGRD